MKTKKEYYVDGVSPTRLPQAKARLIQYDQSAERVKPVTRKTVRAA